MGHRPRVFAVVVVFGLMGVPSAFGQEAADLQAASEPATRAAVIEQEEQAKFARLVPAAPGKAEAFVTRISDAFLAGQLLELRALLFAMELRETRGEDLHRLRPVLQL